MQGKGLAQDLQCLAEVGRIGDERIRQIQHPTDTGHRLRIGRCPFSLDRHGASAATGGQHALGALTFAGVDHQAAGLQHLAHAIGGRESHDQIHLTTRERRKCRVGRTHGHKGHIVRGQANIREHVDHLKFSA